MNKNSKPDIIIGKTIRHQNGMIGFKISFKNKTTANYWKHGIQKYFEMKGLNVLVEVNGYYDEKNIMA